MKMRFDASRELQCSLSDYRAAPATGARQSPSYVIDLIVMSAAVAILDCIQKKV
jgi:hypothetical protein